MKLGFVDTETTGTNPDYHEVWEIGLILVDYDKYEVESHEWQIPFVNFDRLDPQAAAVNGIHERYEPSLTERYAVAAVLASLTDGVKLASCNIAFDIGFLRAFLTGENLAPSWHYSPIDVKSMCYGRDTRLLHGRTDDLIKAAQLPKRQGPHTALSDAQLAKSLYEWACARYHEGG